jgi:ABC-type branched-subunit amino acid transport system ATPase component/ABC-type branched-subunit amino acid transport system permease subunit
MSAQRTAVEPEVREAPAASPPRTGVTARPPAMRGAPYVYFGLFLLGVVLYRQFVVSGLADQDLFNTWLFYAVVVTGFYFVFGISGQFAFSQAVFAAVGGYSSAWATRESPFGADTFWVGLVFAGVVSAALALAFALLMRKASHFYFAIATLGLSAIVLEVLRKWTDFTGAIGDATTGIRPISVFGAEMNNAYRVFWVMLVALALVLLAGIFLGRSPVQREAMADRDQHLVAATLGLPVLRLRLTMFVLGSTIAGLAGSIFVHWKGFASPDDFGIDLGLGIFVMLIVGGIDSLWGPVLGAAFYVYLPRWLQSFDVELFGRDLRSYREVFFGVLLVVTMVAFPEGLVGLGRRARRLFGGHAHGGRRTWITDRLGLTRTRPGTRAGEAARPADGVTTPMPDGDSHGPPRPADTATPMLEAEEIRVRFGGVVAVDGVDLTLQAHEILGLVGPNGSGKTTFLNALTGVVPASGSLRVAGRRVRLGRPGRARGRGVLRTFQTPQTYEHVSCIEDVLLSTSDRRLTGIAAAWLLRPFMLRRERDRWDRATRALERVGLADLAEQPAARLAYGQRRLLELARALAGEPRIVLLDEPSAGLNAAETEQLARHLERVRADGVTILLVDHKLDFVTSLCDRIAVFELGRLVAVGRADDVFSDERVVDAYLGVEEGT